MKKLLNLKIATLLLILGYALPTYGMSGWINRLQSHFSTQRNKSNCPEVVTLAREAIGYNPERDITTTIEHRSESGRDIKVITLIAGMHTDKYGIVYGNEIGQAIITGNHMHWFRVRPEYRQKGYGKQLFYEAANYCQKQGCASMEWGVGAYPAYGSVEKMLKQRELVEFYKKRGGKKKRDSELFSIDLQAKNTKQPSTQFLHF